MSVHRALDDWSGALRNLANRDTGAADSPATNSALFYAAGTTSPTDGKAGYAKGCIFINVHDGIAYINSGTAASSTWTTFTPNGTVAITTADALTVGGVIVPQELEVSFHAQAATAMVDQTFFVANQAYQVTKVRFIHAVAEASAGSLLVQVTKDTGTDAPGAGTDLLTNNTNTGFDCKATANTVQTGTLSATASNLQLAAGGRLSVDFSDSATELVGVTITVTLKRI